MSSDKNLARIEAENDLWIFARLINPHYSYGDIHEKVFRWLSDEGCSHRQLLLLPRGHLKSHCIAVWCAWEVTRKPWTTIMYLSAGESLAKDQIYVIKQMLTSKIYRKYWPLMIKDKEGEREHWSAFSFNVDHPSRKSRGVRDHTVIVKTVGSNFIGHHADNIVFDDVVVPDYAYTESGRDTVNRALSQCASILNPDGYIKAVGTRYHPQDAYSDMIQQTYRIWDEINKEFISEEKLWDIFEEVVEDDGDGTGNFLWPRSSSNGDDFYGFDVQTLEIIKADYISRGETAQFFAQYYNEPNDESTNTLDRSLFQYYDPKFLSASEGFVKYKGKRLNVFAAMDVAWTETEKSDYTAISVIGVDEDSYYYVLDLDRFKTSKFQEYYDSIMRLSNKWGFRKIKIETNAGGKFVANEIERISRENGGTISVKHQSNAGAGSKSKAMRLYAIVYPKYELKIIFHRKDGLTAVLEEELILERPTHDDLSDSLAMALEDAKPPMKTHLQLVSNNKDVISDSRFGGRVR